MDNKCFENALKFMVEKHAGQVRKNGEPYVMHPIRVAVDLRNRGYDLTYQVTALFHDLLEDTDATRDEIAGYGSDILKAVILLSKNFSPDERTYIEKILRDPVAKAVKEADRADNLRDAVKSNDLSFMKRYLKETEEFYLGHFKIDEAYEALKKAVSEKEKGHS